MNSMLRMIAMLMGVVVAGCMPQAHKVAAADATPTYVAAAQPQVLAPPPVPNDRNTVAWPQVNSTAGKRTTAWSPWFIKKQNLSREQFARAIETEDRNILRVRAKEYARMWGNLGLPVTEDPREIATFLRSAKVTEVQCTSQVIKALYLARVDERSGETDFNYVRNYCYTGETFLAYEGTIFVSLGCGNPARERVAPRPMPVAAPASPSCPHVYTLKANVWPPQAQRHPGVAQAMSAAEVSRTMWDSGRVSRKYGGELRKRAESDSNFQRSQTERLVRISLINVDKHDRILKEEVIGDYGVTGLRAFKFTRAQLEWSAIRFIDLREETASPALHSLTSLRELRFYNTPLFQGLPMGEWSTNSVEDCIMNVHFIEEVDGNRAVTLFR